MSEPLRIATFNLENFDDKPDTRPSLDERIAVMRPQMRRINADILCLQEVHGQEIPGEARQLLALEKLIQDTRYENYNIACTETNDDQAYDKRNLVVLSRLPIIQSQQIKHDFAPPPKYLKVTEISDQIKEADDVTWERPILYVQLQLKDGQILHVINLHLKSRIPSYIKGQQISKYRWKSAAGWAEGYFISSMKRVGQALEARILVDNIFNDDENAMIVVCGDYNSETTEVPVEAIRGDVENNNNRDLVNRVLVPCELTVPDSARYSFIQMGKNRLLDHLLVSKTLLSQYTGTTIHNENLHDESFPRQNDKLYPESDHAPIVATFELSS